MKTNLLQLLLCFVMGGLSALAMAPYSWWPVLFVTLSVFYVLLSKAKTKRMAFGQGYLFAFGYFLFGLYWIGNALLVEGNPYVWAWPLAVCGLPILLSFFWGGTALLIHKSCRLETILGYFVFTSIFIVFEWLRGHIFTGFPWNLFGYSWVKLLPVVQIVHFGDVYLLSWLTIFWVTIGGFLYLNKDAFKKTIPLVLVVVLSFAATYGYGAHRLQQNPTSYRDDIELKIVQPNIAQKDKWDRSKMAQNFFKIIRASYPSVDIQEDKLPEETYIIWPETAISYIYSEDESAQNVLAQMLGSYPNPTYLFTGLLRREKDTGKLFNSIVQIDSKGETSNIYNKHHLVPFGEYIPFQRWIPLAPVVQFTGFVPGDGPTLLETPQGISYSPLICYEVIFPGRIKPSGTQIPDLIINSTNDAWYGDSAGPYQHYVQTIFRAVEEGIPLARAANTGISGLIDSLGRNIERSNINENVVLTTKLPTRVHTPSTITVIKKYLLFVLLAAVFIAKLIVCRYFNTKD